MTNLRLTGMTTKASEGIEGHIRALYDGQTATRLVVGEIEHVERTMPGPNSGKTPTVVCRFRHLEVPTAKQQGTIAEVLRALYLLRTAEGTLDEVHGGVRLDDEARKVAEATSVLFVDDALEARAMIRAVLKQLEAISASATADVVKQRRAIRKIIKVVEKFVQNGSAVEELLPELARIDAGEQLKLVEDGSEGDATDGDDGPVDVTEPRHDAAEALAGQDVGTRVPAPEFTPPADPADPSGTTS